MNGAAGDDRKLTLESFRIKERATPNGLEEAEEKLLASVRYPWQKCVIPGGLPANCTKDNIVRANFIRFLVLEGDNQSFVHEKGVQLDGACIEGDLDFHGCDIKRPLFLTNCRFSGALILEDARACTIKLDGSAIGFISAQRARISGGFYLHGCTIAGQLRLIDADIAGSLECHGTQITRADSGPVPARDRHIALYASRAKIAGSAFLHEGCSVTGEVSFRGGKIGGNLTCGSGTLSHPDGSALDCAGVGIGGNVSMDRGFSAHGSVWFNGATVHGKFLCDGGSFNQGTKDGAKALSAKRARIDGSVYLRRLKDRSRPGGVLDFQAIGEINFVDAKIGGSLECHGGKFLNGKGIALYCSRISVAGSVFLHDGFTAEGEVVFRSAVVGSNLNASDSRINCGAQPGTVSRGRKSLSCERMRTGGSLCLKHAEVKYEIDLIDAVIGGSLECHGAKFDNEHGIALHCSRTKIAGSAFLHKGFEARGTVVFRWAGIGANLECDTGSFDGFESPTGRAIECEGVKVYGSVLMGDGFFACGEVHIVNAVIGGSLGCSGGFFSNKRPRGSIEPKCGTGPDAGKRAKAGCLGICADALKLRGSAIKGNVWLGPSNSAPHNRDAAILGSLDLRDVHVGVFIDSETSWPPKTVEAGGKTLACHIFLDGFAYGRIGSPASLNLRLRKRWLERQPAEDLSTGFKAQAFEQLIGVLRGMGQIPAAHKIAVYKERLYTMRPLQSWPVRGCRWWWISPDRLTRLVLFDWVAGYGYRAHRIVIFAILVWLACAIAYLGADQKGLVHPTYAGMHDDEIKACKKALAEKDSKTFKEQSCPEFNPFKYSADVILPIVQQHERAAWTFKLEGSGSLMDMLRTAEHIFGWLAGLILATLLGRKINKE